MMKKDDWDERIERNKKGMNSKERRAVYGAVQRLLDRLPWLMGDEDYELDEEYGTIPGFLKADMIDNRGSVSFDIDDYRDFEPALGEELLRRMIGG